MIQAGGLKSTLHASTSNIEELETLQVISIKALNP